MTNNKTTQEDRSEVGKLTAEKIGKAVLRADIALDGTGYIAPVVAIATIKLKRRDQGGYLLVLTGSHEGSRLVCFKDVDGLAGIAPVIAQVAVDLGAWKTDKYALDKAVVPE